MRKQLLAFCTALTLSGSPSCLTSNLEEINTSPIPDSISELKSRLHDLMNTQDYDGAFELLDATYEINPALITGTIDYRINNSLKQGAIHAEGSTVYLEFPCSAFDLGFVADMQSNHSAFSTLSPFDSFQVLTGPICLGDLATNEE